MLDYYAEKLRSQGYRVTPQRLAILRILQQAEKHLSPSEVYLRTQEILPGMTEATVYRTLSFLDELGIAMEAHMGSGQLVYEIAGHDHHHLICRNCGATMQIDHELLEELYINFQQRTGYRIDSLHTTFFGLCPDCQGE
jgi:Fe2+ or Zn2+ uptake regulation protein